ncbi:hypothetical protein [Saccharopolyspora spinosa]|uniref:hypothetical protein n=1 Tax=Saccharopolyspora spinosa TaxID=60894 RepID=UPI00117B9A73|nr:hypothetical protein [Saccharopolyspora spinosa]
MAEDTGLIAGVNEALADTYAGPWVHAPGRVFTDMAVAIADGADCVSHIEVFGDQHQVCGPVASMPTTWRMLDRIDEAHLPGVLSARAAARGRAWAAGAGGGPERVAADRFRRHGHDFPFIAHRNGGHATAANASGGGAIFTLNFPAAQRSPHPEQQD